MQSKETTENAFKSFGQAIEQCQLLKTFNKQNFYEVFDTFVLYSTGMLPLASAILYFKHLVCHRLPFLSTN